MRFKVNEGPTDRLVRAVVGVVLLGAVAAGWIPVPFLYVALLIGAIGVVTAATGFCLPYALFGISTLPKGAGEAASGRQ